MNSEHAITVIESAVTEISDVTTLERRPDHIVFLDDITQTQTVQLVRLWSTLVDSDLLQIYGRTSMDCKTKW